MLLSVIICVKDEEKYIARAINSIVNQPRFDDIELIIVNDGSKDNTEEIINVFVKKYQNIKTLKHTKNIGVGSSRNDGIKLATSKYISFLDADDWWEKSFFDDELIESLNKDYDLYGFSFQRISYDYSYKKEHNEENRIIKNKSDIVYSGQLLCSFIYKKSIIDNYKLELFNTKINEDITFTQRYFEIIDKIYYSNKTMYNYYMNSNSTMHAPYSNELFNETIKSIELLDSWYKDNSLIFHKEYPILIITAQKLPYLCALNNYDELKKMLSNNLNIDKVLENYEKYPIDDNLMKRINKYKHNSYMFYITNKIIYGIREHIRLFIYKTHVIRKLETHLIYGVVLKAKKINRNELDEQIKV